MQVLTISLLIANITMVVAATKTIVKELVETKNDIKMIDNKVNLMNSCLRSVTKE